MSSKVSIFQRMHIRNTLPLAAASLFLLAEGCTNQQDQQEPAAAQESLSAQLISNPQMALTVQTASAHLLSLRSQLGLNADHSFQARSAYVDIMHRTHLRYDQKFRGVRVWEGDVIVQVGENGAPQLSTQSLRANIDIATVPTLSPSEAQSIAHSELQPKGEYAHAPSAELVVYPVTTQQVKAQRLRGDSSELNAEDVEEGISRYVLAYYVQTALENGAFETKHTDYIIDAHTGEVLKKWNALQTTAASGTGKSQYSGDVPLGTNTSGSGWELHDVARGMNITTYNLKNGTSGTGTVFTDADNGWGDGKNYTKGGTDDNAQTAGVDAHYGTAETYDYYQNVLGRNGIDGAGKATYNRVHYSSKYDNAFWDDTCFCMTYGDGSEFTVLTSIDVAGHEMTHGVTSRTAKLTYSGESGGLNESMSDINGTMVEFYSYNHLHGGAPTTIGDTGGTWTIGEQLNATPLRYMIKPSKDGASPDAWSTSTAGLDVHYSSGPMNRAFYFLSKGASATTGADDYSKYLPSGMTGIGNDKAAKIAFLALSAKMTASTKYAAARTAFLAAATDLYGATSAEYAAVENAFGGINVGMPHSGGGTDTTAPTTAITAPKAGATITGTSTITADASDNIAVTKVEFYVGATLVNSDTTSPYSYAWNSASVANGSYDLTTKAYDAAGNVGTSAKVSVTVSNMVSDTTPPTTTLTSPKIGATLTGTATLAADASDNIAVTKVEFYYGTKLIGASTASPYTFAWNTTGVANGSYDLTSKAYDAAGNVGTSAKVSVTVSNMTSDTVAPNTSLTAPSSGATVSGNVTVSATATDNVAVTKVEFYAGATLIGTDTTSPYSVVWDSTKVADGSYVLTSKAYDAAGNVGTSPNLTVTVKNAGGTCGTTKQLFQNNDFESGATVWNATSGIIDDTDPANAHGGDWVAWFGGFGSKHTDNMYQQITIPAAACSAKLSFWLAIESDELGTKAYDKLVVNVQDAGGKVLGTLATYSNLDEGGYTQKTFDLSAYKGKTVRIAFKGTEDAYLNTNFFVDDTALTITQ